MAIISYKHKFIFIHSRRTGGTSLTLALLKFCDNKDICSQINKNHVKWLESAAIKNYIRPNKSKKLNISGFYNFITSFIKVLPLVKSMFKFNHPPNFSLKIPLYVENYKLYTHCPVKEVKKMVGEDFFNEAIKFTIVRNPYDQFLSYYNAFRDKRNFREFTKRESFYFFNRENSDISLNKTLPYNKIIKYENLKEDIEHLSKLLKLPENLYETFQKIHANKMVKKDFSIIDKDSQKIIYKNAYHFFKLFGYSENINVI